jgi:hypothetical protein
MTDRIDELIETHFKRAALDPDDERGARALVEVLRDEQWMATLVRDLVRRTRLDVTTVEVAVTDAIEDMIKEARRGGIKKTPRAWLIGVARRKANSRTEILSRDPDGRPHPVQHTEFLDDAVGKDDGEPATEETAQRAREEALRKWRELIPRLGWDLAEQVWLEVIRQLELGGPVMDLRSLAEAVGRKFAAVKNAYYQGGERLARLAVEHGVIDPMVLAEDVVIVDDDEEDEDDD